MVMDTENKPLVERVEHALGTSRTARSALTGAALMNIPPARRGMITHFVRLLDKGQLFEEDTLREMDALIAFLEREAETGTERGWQHDENDIHGGYETVEHDETATCLLRGAHVLRQLQEATAKVLDGVAAVYLTMNLLEGA